MAITLNKLAVQCEEIAMDGGCLTPLSSPRPLLYDISRNWRCLLDATSFHGASSNWSEKEEAAADVLIATLVYLRRIGCVNIEKLLRDTVERKARRKA